MLPLQMDKMHFHCCDGVGLATGKGICYKKNVSTIPKKKLWQLLRDLT